MTQNTTIEVDKLRADFKLVVAYWREHEGFTEEDVAEAGEAVRAALENGSNDAKDAAVFYNIKVAELRARGFPFRLMPD